jgi:hypothetical protein
MLITRTFQIWEVDAQQFDRGESFERRHVAATRHDNIGLAAAIIARPRPDAEAGAAVLDSSVHVQPLRRRLLAGDDDVDVVAAAQAVLGD